jgi:hypothetical protein
MIYDILCVFCQSGHTFTFNDVSIITDNESILEFQYKAMSDGLIKVGRFSKFVIAGFSLTRNVTKVITSSKKK